MRGSSPTFWPRRWRPSPGRPATRPSARSAPWAPWLPWRETDRDDDDQGLGAFARLGFADQEVNEVEAFWGLGCQYRGPIPGRDCDVLGLGIAQGRLSSDAALAADHETAVELYYDAQIAPWLHMSLHLQYVANPGGDGDAGDAVSVGLRVQVSF